MSPRVGGQILKTEVFHWQVERHHSQLLKYGGNHHCLGSPGVWPYHLTTRLLTLHLACSSLPDLEVGREGGSHLLVLP